MTVLMADIRALKMYVESLKSCNLHTVACSGTCLLFLPGPVETLNEANSTFQMFLLTHA